MLWFRDDHTVVVGEAALRRAESAPGRMAREFKRRFGDPVPIMVAGTPMSADALTARLLRWVVERVSEQEGGESAAVGVAHPANWGPYKQDLLAQAVRLAGVQHATLVSEPHMSVTVRDFPWEGLSQRTEVPSGATWLGMWPLAAPPQRIHPPSSVPVGLVGLSAHCTPTESGQIAPSWRFCRFLSDEHAVLPIGHC